MLKRVIAKQYHDMQVIDLNNVRHDVKVLNTVASGVRVFLYDMTIVAPPDTAITENHIFQLPSGEWTSVIYKTPHYHNGEVIRYTFDVVTSPEKVTILRPTPIISAQGGPRGMTDSIVCQDIPCKIGLGKTYQDVKIDEDIERFTLLLSSQFSLKKGDKVKIAGGFYKDAKIDGLFMVSAGLQEIRFDIDPRG